MKKTIFILTLALVALAGCKKEPALAPAPEPEPGLTPDTPTTIVFKTSRAVGETITLGFRRSEMQNISMDGAKPESDLPEGDWGIFECKLSSQTVTIKGDITLFDCRNNGITDIALTKDLKLIDFNCSGNELTSLDVSGLTELENFACSSNRLTSLNIEGCDKLCYVECYSNSIKDVAMTDIVNDLPTLDTPGPFIVKAEGCGNVITQDDIDIAARKNWDVVDDKYHSISQRTTFTSPANCYIVTKAGEYAFKTVKGNSSESVGNVASAEVLWETFGTDVTPAVGDLVKDVSYKDGKIVFKTTDKKGNAVIAAKDAAGNILWSWHIWLTDQPVEHVYKNNAGTVMDRNLGATSATPGDVGALGLLYQWGRKDPFLGSSSISSNTTAKSTITWPSAVSSDLSKGTIAYAIANPTTFIANYDTNNNDWYYTGSESTENTRWTTSESNKSIYDPCPSGWRVPDGGNDGVWAKAIGSPDSFNCTYESTYKGFNFSGKFGSASTIWYPASGYRTNLGGSLKRVGEAGNYWSASPNDSRAHHLYFFNTGNVYPSTYYYSRATGQSVRCVKGSEDEVTYQYITLTTKKAVGEEFQFSIEIDGLGDLSADERMAILQAAVVDMNITDVAGYSDFYDVKGTLKKSNLKIEIAGSIGRFTCQEMGLTSLDVSHCPELYNIYCRKNDLTELDISKNTKLETLHCGNNILSSLDVSNATELQYLYCRYNSIETLDVSKNLNLKKLVCYDNKLTSLDVSKNTKLDYVECDSNQLESLLICSSVADGYLYLTCYKNKLDEAAMTALIEALPTAQQSDAKVLLYDNSDSNELNKLTDEHIAAAKAKGYTVKIRESDASGWETK